MKGRDELKKSEKTEQKIFMAAGKLFSEQGFSGTTTSQIAKEAGISEGTVFRHFQTKKEILIRLVTYGIEMFSDTIAIDPLRQLAKNSEKSSLESYLFEIAMDRFNLLKKYKEIAMIVMNELSFHREIKELFHKNIGQKVNEIIVDSYEGFVKRDLVRKDIDASKAINAFSGMVLMIFMEHIHGFNDSDSDLEQEVKAAIDIFVNGVGIRS